MEYLKIGQKRMRTSLVVGLASANNFSSPCYGNKIPKFNFSSLLYVRLRKAIDDMLPHKTWDV